MIGQSNRLDQIFLIKSQLEPHIVHNGILSQLCIITLMDQILFHHRPTE